MNELIVIGKQDVGEGTVQTINARDLHTFVESKQDFSDWIKKRIKQYGFVENQDYVCLHKKMEANNATLIDYHLTIDMAKELSMVERNEKGKQARQYFIECERKALQPSSQFQIPETLSEALRLAADAIDQNKRLERQIEADRPKTIFADAVSASHTSILVGELAKLLKQNGIEIGQNRLFVWLRENGYLIKRNGADWNMPTQRSMEMCLFEIKERTINEPSGSVRITKTVKVTGKGQLYFVNKFVGEKEVLGAVAEIATAEN